MNRVGLETYRFLQRFFSSTSVRWRTWFSVWVGAALLFLAVDPIRADIVNLQNGWIALTNGPAGDHYTQYRNGTLTEWCVSIGLITPDSGGPDVEYCVCADPSRMGSDDGQQKAVFVAKEAGPCAASGPCDLAVGQWTMNTENVGQSTWTFTPLGGGQYSAQESGLGNATGTATLSGNTIQIEWKTTGGYSGRLDLTLDPSCRSAEGTHFFYTGRTGSESTHWTRI